ncbi:putative quinol monooxygenase [Saccharopolyspora phatthalungensis]|uniref:Quinol monooxygenase YgiN n=1 Tax=Saccharopolyspora phatthalungensis TaxID=664693 RepID=A0A840Q621_9PSEU|nr:antibiotic biosynthesis monooxygenase family protein [Saccharopolyspora phatthalungensis]MBB5155320.1 quinol monooxygenase YgiN [Saccharopolyspora phatthalungensis]
MTTKVGRLMAFTAKPGRGGDLAAAMLQVAEGLREVPGCELYIISQDSGDPDTVRVVEAWADEASADAALAAAANFAGDVSIESVLGMLAKPPERVDLTTLGGVGL